MGRHELYQSDRVQIKLDTYMRRPGYDQERQGHDQTQTDMITGGTDRNRADRDMIRLIEISS